MAETEERAPLSVTYQKQARSESFKFETRSSSAGPIRIDQAPTLKPLPAEDSLGFGKHFSDHLFSARYSSTRGWHDLQVGPYQSLTLDPAASVLHYGQALFEGLKAFRQPDGSVALFRPEYNWARMVSGAERLCMVAPPREIFFSGLKTLLEVDSRWVPHDPLGSLYIRPTLIGTEGFLGVRPAEQLLFYILLSPVGSYYGGDVSKPVRIWVETEAVRAVPGGLGSTKAGANYAASLQSALKAKKRGYDQVLWLDSQQEGIEEVGTMNVFFVFQNEIVTPGLNGSILAGCVRDSVLRWLRDQGRPVVERRITLEEVIQRHARNELLEAFGTGTAAVISPIGEFATLDRTLRLNPVAGGGLSRELLTEISGIQRGLRPDPYGWRVTLQGLSR
ncbi:MAG: branched-chain amino acid aminotransferase [Bdellovibrionales bacterium]